MKRKMISWLAFMAVFLFLLHSCVHDEIYSSSDPASREYHSKSVFKEDEKYIKNVMDIYFENEEAIKKTTGTPLWDYAMTMGTMDESFLIVPVADGKTVITCLQVPRNGNYVRFLYDNDREHIKFFQNYLLSEKREPVKQEPYSSPTGKGLAECKVTAVSMWYPADEYGSNAGYWETNYIITCPPEETDGDGNESGPGDTTYPYPGGGGNPNPQNPKTPCEKTKSVLNKPNVQAGITTVKAQALQTLSNINAGETGFKEKKDGTTAPADINSSHKVVYNDVTDGVGGYHNHTANGTHMFSPPDIADTLLGFAAAQNNVSDAYFGMIAAEWCNCPPSNKQFLHYVIQYTGAAADLGTGGNYNFTAAQMTQFENDYRKTVRNLKNTYINGNTYIQTSGELNEKGLEKLFFEMLNTMGLTGNINLQRVEANGTIYNVTLNSNNMPTGTPCP